MTRPSLFGPIIACLVMFSSAALPFGADGHRIIAKIAENHLSDKTAQAVGEVTASEDLAKISLWPDRIRHLSGWKQSKYWHYINIDDNEQLSNFPRDEDGDVISALEHFYTELQNPQLNSKQRREALAFFSHFVGDIHQPLHVGRRDDRGGNNISVKWLDSSKSANLHQVWDRLMTDTENKSPAQYSRSLDSLSPNSLSPSSLSLNGENQTQLNQWQHCDFWAWAQESKALRSQVYDLGTKTPNKRLPINNAYVQRNKPVIEQRLLMAGVRLAGCLNDIFDPQKKSLKTSLKK